MRIRDAHFYRIKAAMADLIDRAGGQKRSGEIVGLSQQMMSRVCLRDDATMLSGDAKLRLEMECGAPIVTAVEAQILGHRLEPLERRPGAPEGTPYDAHAAVMIEMADLARAFAESVRDGKYSRTDAATVDKALAELIEQAERFRRINAAEQAGGP